MRKLLTTIGTVVIAGGVTVLVAFAANQMKTEDMLIYSSSASVSTAQNAPFTLYLGDNLAGITTPVKSLYFIASGVYTGGGTVSLSLDSVSGTTQTFTLPTVTNPTPFEFIYKDPSNYISPTSAGSYSYTLNISPTSVVLYGLGVKMTETHQYVPPACGGLPILGDLISVIFDSTVTGGAGYNSVLWKGALGGTGANEGKVRFQFAASNNSAGPWNYYGAACVGGTGDWFDPLAPNTPMELKGTGASAATCQTAWNNMRYFRYKIEICSNDCVTAGANTPTVNGVVVSWAP